MEENPLILIVDDIPENIEVLLQILYRDNYLFGIATNGEETYSAIENQHPDLILLDIMLPDTDGFEICKNLKSIEKTADIPIIFLSARVELEDKVKGFKLGAVDYITKPFEEEEVIARVRTHIRLKQVEKQLRDANKSKDKMFSIIGHDLRNPIGSFKTTLDLLVNRQDMFKGDSLNSMLKTLKNSADATFSLLENLLFWARSQRGKIKYLPTNINLYSIVQGLEFLIKNSLNEKNITLNSFIDTDINVFADSNMLQTIFRNLITNAIKFTENNGTIKISVKKDKFLEVSIKDNGIGMSQEVQDRIFKKNEHFTSFGTNDERGSGLGLMLCKDFIKKHNCKMWVESEVGKGSNFKFTLPLVKN